MTKEEIAEGKNNAIASYFTLIGALIAWSLNFNKRNKFSSFHIRQSIGLNLGWIVIFVFISGFNNYLVENSLPFLEENPNFIMFILTPFYLVFALFWGYGFIGALNGKTAQIPLVGRLFQKWFNKVA